MTELDVEILKQEILSLLVSAKNGLTEYELLNDYRSFNSNKDLPYKALGYSSLVFLLRSWSDVCRIQQQGNNGAFKILAVEEESTKHILSMVRGQRQGKSRRQRGRGGGRNRARGGQRGDGGRNDGRDNYRGARFSQGSFNFNNNRSGGTGDGGSNGTAAFNNNRAMPQRSHMGQSNQNSNNKPNVSVPPRYAKTQQQQIRSHITGSGQHYTSSYESRQSTNSQFFDDRRVINNASSLRIIVANNNNNNNRSNNANEMNNDYQHSSDAALRLSDYELNEDEEQYDEEEEDKEEEVINNLQKLLTDYSHGVRLLALNDLYQKQFGKSLLTELKIANILLLQDFVDDFASISRHGEENGSCDHIITLKDPKQVAQSQAQLLKQITDSGIVPKSFRYADNLSSYINDSRFQGFVSDIDKSEHCLHVQPVRYQEHIETLMEELNSYYSSSISNTLIIKDIETGLSCVTKYGGLYHRVFIKESDLYKCVIVYVDYGTMEEINKDEQQFKYLLKHFAELPCMAITCRLYDVRFLPDDNQWLPETYNEIYSLCKDGPFFIEPMDKMNGLLTIRILDADQRCLNDIVVESKLAVKLSAVPNHSSADIYEQQQQTGPKPVALNFDFLDNAAQCPLPDSGPTTPESNTTNSAFKLPENISSQLTNNSSNVEYQCKLIQIDDNASFYLIRYNNNKPYIPCFDLARLLHLSESDILSETLLSRILLQQTTEYRATFDFIRQTNPKDCLHIDQNLLFLFDLTTAVKYIERLDQIDYRILLSALRRQIDASNEPQFWANVYDYYEHPSAAAAAAPTLSVQSSNQSDVERYSELLTRRYLCSMNI